MFSVEGGQSPHRPSSCKSGHPVEILMVWLNNTASLDHYIYNSGGGTGQADQASARPG